MIKLRINNHTAKADNEGCAVIIGIILILLVALYFFICWTDGNLEYVVSSLKDREVSIPFWISAIISILGSFAIFIFNIVCEIVKL